MRITRLKQLLSEEQIQARIRELAEEINAVYKGEPLVVVCVLKGAFMFSQIWSNDLTENLNSTSCVLPATEMPLKAATLSILPKMLKSDWKANTF